ncbi:hypothetical protein cand_015870 [Cryptosporidium andersoni]|uniref:Uncharacterized protein n=1 Tax=Cryptosporidium andersoni TaxID=117008 RepID=A0A1J4MWX5_9CRYT|nr:hypothetical protein cand_015870 [Cryptosporidium andersoni]
MDVSDLSTLCVISIIVLVLVSWIMSTHLKHEETIPKRRIKKKIVKQKPAETNEEKTEILTTHRPRARSAKAEVIGQNKTSTKSNATDDPIRTRRNASLKKSNATEEAPVTKKRVTRSSSKKL